MSFGAPVADDPARPFDVDEDVASLKREGVDVAKRALTSFDVDEDVASLKHARRVVDDGIDDIPSTSTKTSPH